MDIKLFGYILSIKLYKLPKYATVGLTNRTTDNYFVLFLDYDNVEDKVVFEDCDFLQKNFDVGTLLVLQTKKLYEKEGCVVGNYHVIGFTKYTFPQIKEMIFLTRCHEHFKKGYKYQSRSWVLRCCKKGGNDIPRVHKIIVAKTNKTANLALLNFVEKYYNVSLHKYFKKKDKLKDVEIIEYVTK